MSATRSIRSSFTVCLVRSNYLYKRIPLSPSLILHDPHLDLKAHRAVVRVVAPVPISGEMIGEGMALSQMVLGIPLKGIRKLRDADSMP